MHLAAATPPHDVMVVNEVGQAVLLAAAIVLLVVQLRRQQTLDKRQREVGLAAFFGLMLCSRFAGMIHYGWDWAFVAGCALIFGKLAYDAIKPGRI